MTLDQLKAKISSAFQTYLGTGATKSSNLIPKTGLVGKVYEAYILSIILRDLVVKEGCSLTLTSGSKIQLKSSPGPINRKYPHIFVRRGNKQIGEIWTDVEFTSLSYWQGMQASPPSKGEYHELDILVTSPRPDSRPMPDQVLIGVECKATTYQKDLLRQILGVRRELSLLQLSIPTIFKTWPRSAVPAEPPSCLLVYSTSATVVDYAAPGDTFGIDFVHEPI